MEGSVPWGLACDCADPRRLAEFWNLALGYVDAPPPAGFDSWEAWFDAFEVPAEERNDGATIAHPRGEAPAITFLRVPEGKVAKNRLHLDVKAGGGRATPPATREARVRETVARLADAGGAVLQEHHIAGALDHVVMADPEGNEFCVV